jgi:GPH family glycoside/pentoside/hexuronide:cation symporter
MTEAQETKYGEKISTKRIVCFTLSGIISGFLFSMWGQIQYFAAAVLLIPQTIIPLIYLIYSIVDGINDPIIGYLTDKSKRFTSKFGKRFPWIFIGVVASPILLILCFIPVSSDVAIAALWLSVIMVIYESCATLYEINHNALFPDLFRDPAQRRKQTGLGGILGGIVSVLSAITIPIILEGLGGTTTTAYLGTTLIVIIIVYALIVPYILGGVREPTEMKLFRAELDAAKKSSSPVKETLIRILKDKNWMAIVIVNFCWAIAGACLIYGLNFYVTDNLGLLIGATALPLLFVSLVAVICAPIWVWVSKKIGARNAYIAGLLFNAIGYFLFMFATDINSAAIIFAFAGIGYSATYGVMIKLVWAEGIDNAVIEGGKREEGSYNGVLRIFSAFSYFLQTTIFAIVAVFTGYDPALGTANSDPAKLGLKIQMSLIPMIIVLIGTIIFLLMHKITKDKAEENKKKLKELGL